MAKDLTFIAETNFRKGEVKFGIKRVDRRQHMYVIGKTGVGKTGFLKNMALQDIENGQGLAIIDPHGEFVEEILDSIPPHRMKDVVYFNPADMEHPVSFNIMDVQDPKYKHLIASGLLGIFTKIWANVWSARMEYILANCILALLDTPGTTLLGIPRMLVDRDYRQKIINNLKDPVVKSFWINEYEEWESRYRNEAIAPVQNKVGQFLNVSFVRNIVGQAKNTIDIDDIMNNQKILLVNVSKGRIGEDNAAILGAMIITKIQLAAMERVRIPEDERKDFYLYVDEFQNFATDSFVNILSEARKYRLDLIIAHQYVGQLTTDTSTAVRDAVFGNVGTMLTFRVGAADAEFLEQEYMPEFLQNDLIRLPNRNIYIKLMIDGITSRPFSARTITVAPVKKDDKKHDEIVAFSRSKYSRPVKVVEEEINRWAANLDVPNTSDEQTSSDLSNPQNSSKPLYQPNGAKTADSTKLYNVKCSNCGKDTKVIFEPVPGRPVYCKNCLKKIKAGEITPAEFSALSSPSSERPNSAPRVSASLPQRADSPRRSMAGNSALGDLGIEFEASSTPRKTPSRIDKNKTSSVKKVQNNQRIEESAAKIEQISFHSSNKRQGDNKNSEKPTKRKEINLSELRQALEESLSKKEEPEEPTSAQASAIDKSSARRVDEAKKEVVSNEGIVTPDMIEKLIVAAEPSPEELSSENIEEPPAQPKDELSRRIEAEKEMDKAVEEENLKVEPKNKKKPIKPGETVKF
jgi:CxxC-x17-CxxC domain-containing protein